MCSYPWQVQREDQTSVLACSPYRKACQSNSGVHPFPGVFSFRILLWCLPQEVALGCQPGRVTSWPQGAAPRGTGTSRAVHDPWPCLQHSERALTCSKSRGWPAHCPPPAGPVGKEPGAEAWYVSGGHHQFSSHHRKSLQWLSRGCWHLWAQNLPEPNNTAFDRDVGVSLIPGGAVGVALGTNSLPSLVHSIPSLDNWPTGIESEHLFLMIHL